MDNNPQDILDSLLHKYCGPEKRLSWFNTLNETQKMIQLGLLFNATIINSEIPDPIGSSENLNQLIQVLMGNYGADPLLPVPSDCFLNSKNERIFILTSPIQYAIQIKKLEVLHCIASLRPDIFQKKENIECFLGWATPQKNCCHSPSALSDWLLDHWTRILEKKSACLCGKETICSSY